MQMFHLTIKQFERFVEWLNKIYAPISVAAFSSTNYHDISRLLLLTIIFKVKTSQY